jgi:hypothetical protein
MNRAAQSLGRKGGKARALALDAPQRQKIAGNAAAARWRDVARCPCGLMTAKGAKRAKHICTSELLSGGE